MMIMKRKTRFVKYMMCKVSENLLWHVEFLMPLWQDIFVGTNIFDPVTLTMEFGLLFENSNLVNNFSTVSARA